MALHSRSLVTENWSKPCGKVFMKKPLTTKGTKLHEGNNHIANYSL
jgi:hypothetical protein